jgi:hypothetical protein
MEVSCKGLPLNFGLPHPPLHQQLGPRHPVAWWGPHQHACLQVLGVSRQHSTSEHSTQDQHATAHTVSADRVAGIACTSNTPCNTQLA